MKDRQRWSGEEDALLSDYVRQYGPQDFHLVAQRTNAALSRDSKSCLERWKNYLKPGLKRGSLSDEEQRLVIRLQAKHGNKWKKIAAEVPGRTAKRLGKWWEVYKEKQLRESKEGGVGRSVVDPIEERKYDTILENFAEKLVKERAGVGFLMAPANGGGGGGGGGGGSFLQSEPQIAPPPQMLPPWLSNSAANCTSQVVAARPPSPSVTLSLSSPTVAAPPAPASIPWLPPPPPPGLMGGNMGESMLVASELAECCRELQEGQRAWAAHRKEAAWRLKRVELQLESEKACKRREKMEEIEAKMKALREEQLAAIDRIEAEYREQLAGLRRDAEAKELKLAEQWAAKHVRLTKLIEHVGLGPRISEPSPH